MLQTNSINKILDWTLIRKGNRRGRPLFPAGAVSLSGTESVGSPDVNRFPSVYDAPITQQTSAQSDPEREPEQVKLLISAEWRRGFAWLAA